MKTELKVRGEFHWDFKNYFLTEILSNQYTTKRVEKNPELTIGLVEPTPLTEEFLNSPKKVLVAGENLYYKITVSKLLEYLTKKKGLRLKYLNKILPRRVLDIRLSPMRPKYLGYVKNIAENSPKGEYAIITNNIKGRNILNIPFFLQVKQIRDRIDQLKNKKLQSRIPKNFCCIIISNESSPERIDFFKQLSKYKKVDCFGKTRYTNSDNSLLPKSWADNPKFLSQYKFVISFENSFEEEYITEKLPNTMLAGSIPIYRGALNIGDYFNKESFINFEDCGKSYKRMLQKIKELDTDDKKYLEFISRPWMTKKNKTKFDAKEKELKNFLRRIIKE
jgi:hypothetical protein